MITLEEKIKRLEAIADFGDELYADYEEHGLQDTHGARRAKSLIEEKRQEIAWFCELQERRKAPEIIRCKDCQKYNQSYGLTDAYNLICHLPSAQPEPKEGRWIDKGWDGDWAWYADGCGKCWRVMECSECGKSVSVESNYCPNCGSKMRKEIND